MAFPITSKSPDPALSDPSLEESRRSSWVVQLLSVAVKDRGKLAESFTKAGIQASTGNGGISITPSEGYPEKLRNALRSVIADHKDEIVEKLSTDRALLHGLDKIKSFAAPKDYAEVVGKLMGAMLTDVDPAHVQVALGYAKGSRVTQR